MSSFPELIWIQQESPQDDLAEASHEIRKLGRKSPDHMKPVKEEDEVDLEDGKVVEANGSRVPNGSKKEDEITRLVENEYISLFIENVLSTEFSMLSLNPKSEEVPRSTRRTFVPDILLKNQLLSSLANGDKKEAFQPLFSTPTQEIKSSRMKDPSAQKEYSGTDYANTEINRILKLLEKSTVQENLNTNTKSNINTSNITNINCDDGEHMENEVITEKKEFPAFSNLCSKTGVDEVWYQVNSEYWQSLEKASKEEISNQNVKGSVKTDVTLPQAEIKKRKRFFSKAPGAKIDVKSEPGDDQCHNDLQDCQSLIKISNESELFSRKGESGFHETHFSFPHAEVGTYKLFSPDSPFRVPLITTPSTPRPYDDPKAKTSTSTTVAVKPTFTNNLYYNTPALRHYPSTVAVRPMIPPYFHTFMTPTNSFYQYRPCYQTPLQQIPPKYLALNHNTHLGGFSRQRVPFSPFPVGQPLFSARHNPMMTYTPFMHAYYGWRPHIIPVTRNLPPVAAEGPRYMLPHPFRYSVPPLTRPFLNYPYFTSRGNGMKPI